MVGVVVIVTISRCQKPLETLSGQEDLRRAGQEGSHLSGGEAEAREGAWPPETVGARFLGEESGLGPRLCQAPAVWPWGSVPSWCPHPWKMRLGTSPAEIIAGHTLPREAQKVLNRGFLPPPWGC